MTCVWRGVLSLPASLYIPLLVLHDLHTADTPHFDTCTQLACINTPSLTLIIYLITGEQLRNKEIKDNFLLKEYWWLFFQLDVLL